MKTVCACEDKEILKTIVARYRGRSGVLVDVLHDIQHEYGYLPDSALRFVAGELGIPEVRIFGVASFYAGFHFTPQPDNQIKVCVGTACHVRGAPRIVKAFEQLLGVESGQATEDLTLGLDTVSCVGCCALAPVVVVNGSVSRKSSPERIVEEIRSSLGEDNEVE